MTSFFHRFLIGPCPDLAPVDADRLVRRAQTATWLAVGMGLGWIGTFAVLAAQKLGVLP
jgi:hypothetical protein